MDEREPELLADLVTSLADDEGVEPSGRERADRDPRSAGHGTDLQLDSGRYAAEARKQLDRLAHPQLRGTGGERIDVGTVSLRSGGATGEQGEEERQTSERTRQGHEDSLNAGALQDLETGQRANEASSATDLQNVRWPSLIPSRRNL